MYTFVPAAPSQRIWYAQICHRLLSGLLIGTPPSVPTGSSTAPAKVPDTMSAMRISAGFQLLVVLVMALLP